MLVNAIFESSLQSINPIYLGVVLGELDPSGSFDSLNVYLDIVLTRLLDIRD